MSDPAPPKPLTNEELGFIGGKWERFGNRLTHDDGEGSIVGASFIIATSGVTDVANLLATISARDAEIDRLLPANLSSVIHADCGATIKGLEEEIERLRLRRFPEPQYPLEPPT